VQQTSQESEQKNASGVKNGKCGILSLVNCYGQMMHTWHAIIHSK